MANRSALTIKEPPLVTFGLAAYNQEDFIEAAVEAALSQSYSPLEIIMSDDSSTDGTYEVMRRAAANYRGPHKILLNRNPHNLGLVEHCNKILQMASGEILVTAGGDDISLPERVSEIVAKFQSDPRIQSVISDVELFGDKLGYLPRRNLNRQAPLLETVLLRQFPAGMSAAYKVDTLRKFPPLDTCQRAEDISWSFRCALCGVNAYVPKALVKYRVHIKSIMHNVNDPQYSIKIAELNYFAWLQNFKDFTYYCKNFNKLAFIYLPFLYARVFHETKNIERVKTKRLASAVDIIVAYMLKCCRILRLIDAPGWRGRKNASKITNIAI